MEFDFEEVSKYLHIYWSTTDIIPGKKIVENKMSIRHCKESDFEGFDSKIWS